jgi:hypothetical protein
VPAAPFDSSDASQDFGERNGSIRIAEAVALGDDPFAGAGDDAMGHQALVALEDYDITDANGTGGANDFEQIARLHGWEHAGTGDRETRLAERSEDFGGQVQFEGFYQLVFITRL